MCAVYFLWIIPRRLEFICRRFGTLCLFHLHKQVDLPAYKDGTECSETSAYKLHTLRNYPKESIQHSEHGQSLKSRIISCNFIRPGIPSPWSQFILEIWGQKPIYTFGTYFKVIIIIIIIIIILNYLLTPWSRVLLEKLTGSAASQEIPRIFGTRRFLTVLTSARRLFLS